MMKKKILFLIHDFRGRGAEKVLLTLLSKFSREKYGLGVFVYHDTFTQQLPKDVELLCANLEPAPDSSGFLRKIWMFIIKIITLKRTLNAYKPDLIFSVAGTNIDLMIVKNFLSIDPKIILSEHTFPAIDTKRIQNRLERFLVNFAISTTCRHAKMMIVPSQGVSDHLVQSYGVSAKIITVIPNPVDTEQILNAAKEPSDFTFPDDSSFRIGFVGGLTGEKNVACLLRAYASLQKRGVRARVFIIGEGIERATLRALSEQLDIAQGVHFLGYRTNPYPLLKKFDVLVVPSYYETFSYAMLEAMACRVPVISSKWPYCEYMYKHNENCLLFPVNDCEQLSRLIHKLMTDKELRIRLVENGQLLLKKCKIDVIVMQYEAAIETSMMS
jgi:glycosyltransferase involved in cell wall biosynthesis